MFGSFCQTRAAAMPPKKTKTKKPKKDRKKRSRSWSTCEVRGNDDAERHRKSREKKNKQGRSKRNDRPRSPRKIRADRKLCKKTDGESMKVKSEGKKGSQSSKRIAIPSAGKHSSLPHCTSTSALHSSSHSPEAPTNERRKSLGKRTSSSEEPGKRAAEEEEKKKELMKRKASKEECYPVAKRRSNEEEADVKSRDKKKLVEMGYRKSNDKCTSEWKDRSKEKNQGQHSSKESKHPACAVKPNFRLKFQATRHAESACPPVSTEKPPSSSPSQKISFKIPKKSNVKPQTSTTCWGNIKKSPIIHKSSPKIIDSPSVTVVKEQTRPKPSEVSSPLASFSPPVQRRQSCRTEEPSAPSSSDALVEHTRCNDVSTECTETTDDYEMQIVEELHLARSNRQLQVKVERSYGELTSMDVDPADESVAAAALGQKPQQQKQDLLIVLDTNVLLSHLDFVKKIRSHGLGALGFPSLLIPWVVLQELDSLKSGKLSKNVESKARPAVEYIYTSLKNQVPRLWGQSMQQMSQASCRLNAVNNDDLVLQCCLQYKAMYPEGTVMLCTNDKNLCSKALLSGVQALSKADLQQQAAVNPEHFHQGYDPTPAYPHAAPNKQSQEAEEAQKSRDETKETERELSECVSVLESSLQTALSAILEEEMKAAFGELWLEIVYVKPPWSLAALLQCFRKHWIAVFGVIIRRSLMGCVETLSSFVHADVSVERNTVLNAASVAEELLTELRCRSSYGGRVDPTLSCLQTLQHRLQDKPEKPPVADRDGDTLMADAVQDVALPPQASHQEVWALFESIWNNVCHVSSAVFSALHFSPGSVGSVEAPLSMPPPEEALSCLHRLNAALEQLLEAFQRLLSGDSTVDDAQALLTFIHASKIAAMEPAFTAKDLFECLSHQEYREKLCIGGAQLVELRENLHRCAAAVRGMKT